MIIALIIIFAIKGGDKMKEVNSNEEKNVRASVIAGSWYPADRSVLINEIKSYLGEKSIKKPVKGLVVPHAGYRFSGRVAGKAYSELKSQEIERVIILAPSHYVPFSGASICNFTHYETPLGEVKVSKHSKDLVRENELFKNLPEAHQREHAIEIQLPFLQQVLKEFEIIPIIIGPRTSFQETKSIANQLKPLINSKTIVIASSDFTHYGPNYGYLPFRENIEENLKQLDTEAARLIVTKNASGFHEFIKTTGATICGHLPITVLIHLMGDAKGQPLAYDTSGNLMKDFSNSVSYYSIAFFKNASEANSSEKKLSKNIKKTLMRMAKTTLEKHVKGEKLESPEDMLNRISKELRLPEEELQYLKSKKGCFVTLNKNSQLRGCIGTILPREELYKCVYRNAINAASRDIRFNPVSPQELEDIEVEISVLTVPQELEYQDAEDLKEKLKPLRDGVIISKGFRQATYLPQVWEQLPNKEEFLSRLCLKAGLPQDIWKTGDVKVETYQAIVFDEHQI